MAFRSHNSSSSRTNSNGFFSNIFTKESTSDSMKGAMKLKAIFIIIIIVCIICALV